jgi:hypothetical protein
LEHPHSRQAALIEPLEYVADDEGRLVQPGGDLDALMYIRGRVHQFRDDCGTMASYVGMKVRVYCSKPQTVTVSKMGRALRPKGVTV